MVSLDFTPFIYLVQLKMGKNYQQAVILRATERWR